MTRVQFTSSENDNYLWTEEKTEYFFQVIKERNIATTVIRKRTKAAYFCRTSDNHGLSASHCQTETSANHNCIYRNF